MSRLRALRRPRRGLLILQRRGRAGRIADVRPGVMKRGAGALLDAGVAVDPTSLRADVDAVLDKILEKGVGSLTDEERQILDRAGRG